MTRPARHSLFRASLYPAFRRVEGNQVPRFLLWTAWQVRGASREGVHGIPTSALPSLLALDELFDAVLPHDFRTAHRIHTLPHPGEARPWRGVPCDLGLCTLWLFSEDFASTLQLRLVARLPRGRTSPEPLYPLIGAEFLRHYQPRLSLWYDRFRYGLSAGLTEPVGRLSWR
jgi:hypothetical protein